ncbi:MAG: 3,4-dihydroxy-2-butanone-4-phosphate synthase [Proteobacteria bacterium]|nr:3,4-dihydroxy-2-butanone-4-phosphate synthase [Pseudomonadota bacterium]HQR03152.1 3,4-dihydroxy-2-butanone-4-phosphate synthase [Rhodocyclaceae bacterium]
MQLDSVGDLVEALRARRMVVVVDEATGNGAGCLVMAADAVDEAAVNFMVKEARGLVCVAISEERRRRLNLPLMAKDTRRGNRYTVSVEAAQGVSTGISAADRALTIGVLVAGDTQPDDLVQPGHIFPLVAQPDGVLRRGGFEEAGVDLATLAGRAPAAAMVEILDDAGEVARGPALEAFARRHGLPLCSIGELIHHRMLVEKPIRRVRETPVETPYGRFDLIAYEDVPVGAVHLALVRGKPRADVPVHCRVQTLEILRDVLHYTHPSDPGAWNADRALAFLARQECAVMVLISDPQPRDAMLEDIDGLVRSPQTGPSVAAQRSLGIGAQILRDTGVGKMLHLSHPVPQKAVTGFGLEVVQYLPYPG